jgi:TetR/AcrR family transcriptional regulator, ethionamide resistance regulator
MPPVTRTTRSRNRQIRREEFQRRLLVALEQHLEHESYTELTVDQLVEAGGMSRSAFYLLFDDKNDLLRALYREVVRDLIDGPWWNLPPAATKNEQLERFRSLFSAYQTHNKLMRAVSEVAAYDEFVRKDFDEMMRTSVEAVTAYIRAGQEQGLMRPELDTHAVGACLTWMVQQVLLRYVTSTWTQETERQLNAVVDVYWITLCEGVQQGPS